ncbi:arylsulfatase [Ohtaekwangia koreensis]|uniref:Arylsulfatase n=1 Tax=Ohtaekwangia koreensis TaxID=688867 RepID=A0A1T5MD70_9BACT|nr:arylsulfatase [Ohtaekwangia koreensis]SKC86162.1 arylsulfatase [Ohtaekwangia koreensis]
MKNRISWMASVILFAVSSYTLPDAYAQKSKGQKPNIILIMADDMGYSDIGSYGGEINTPNLDRLATEGLRFKEFYNNSICAPTRASLITGQYPHRAGLGYFDVDLGLPAYQGFLNKQSLTFGEVLRGAGYSTLLSGKWHVGKDSLSWPNQRGFDQFYGVLGGGANYFNDYPMPLGGRDYPVVLLENNKKLKPKPDSYYFTDEITNHAVNFLDEQDKSGKPFFLYLAYTAPHWPLHALPEDIAKYKGKFDQGWDELRKQRHARQIQLGIVPADSKIAQRDDIPAWENLTYDEQKLWASRMEVYAAMIDRMDQGIGKILSTLKALKKDDNTLIIFISDNGAEGGTYTLGARGKRYNSGPVGTSGSFDYVYKNWAQVSNTPFRSYKNNMHEGGISSPFIAWYPKKIKGNTIVKGTGHLIDLAPTFYDIAQAKYPSSFQGTTTHNLVGKSLLPVLTGVTTEVNRSEPIFWERAGNRAVRKGKWKLVSDYEKNKWELYDLEKDRGETTDLADQNPQVVRELSFDYQQWAVRTGVVDYETIKPKDAIGPVNEKKKGDGK